ncbi:MAG: hypothetical protein HYU64_06655 [Armatimonadetes bacterium]|nr:hypothetical protein [Armatimonadota bacterium]
MGIKIQKEKIPVILITATHRMEGEMHVVAGGRLLDEINKDRDFIPITNVTIYALNETTPLDTLEFLAVNKTAVNFIAPAS